MRGERSLALVQKSHRMDKYLATGYCRRHQGNDVQPKYTKREPGWKPMKDGGQRLEAVAVFAPQSVFRTLQQSTPPQSVDYSIPHLAARVISQNTYFFLLQRAVALAFISESFAKAA